jgi:hypothetical protein
MPYCPTCKKEFKGDLTQCPDDQATLVGELPFQAVPGENTTWVEIASAGTEDEAMLLQGFLENEGIPAVVENVKFRMEPVNFGDMSQIRIYVVADDEDQALLLLRQREKEYDKLDDDDDTLVTDEGPADIDENAPPEPE